MKRTEKLFDAITDVRDDLIEAAQEYRFMRRPPVWKRYGSFAACLALIVGVAFLFQLGFFGGMSGNDAANNSAASNGATMDSGASDNAVSNDAGDSGNDGNTGDTGADYPWHDDLILPVTIEDGEDLLVLRDLRLTGGNELLVEDVYTITSAEDRQITLLCPVVGRPSGFGGVTVTVNGGEDNLAEDIIYVGEDLTEPTMEMPLSERGQLDDGFLWAFWTKAEFPVSAGETVEVHVSYWKPMPVSGEISMGGIPAQSVTLDGKTVAVPDEGNLFFMMG